MSKEKEYQVGDNVIINDGVQNGLHGVIIVKRIIDRDYYYTVDLGVELSGYTHNGDIKGHAETCRYYGAYQLKDAKDNHDWKVVIIPKGDTTLLRLYENNKVVKTEQVRRYVDDEYDKNVAIREVVNKLLGDNVPVSKNTYQYGYLRSAASDENEGYLGAIGEPTDLVDLLGNRLHIGDVVLVLDLCSDIVENYGEHVIVHGKNSAYIQGNSVGDILYFRVRHWDAIKHGEIIDGVEYIKEQHRRHV